MKQIDDQTLAKILYDIIEINNELEKLREISLSIDDRIRKLEDIEILVPIHLESMYIESIATSSMKQLTKINQQLLPDESIYSYIRSHLPSKYFPDALLEEELEDDNDDIDQEDVTYDDFEE